MSQRVVVRAPNHLGDCVMALPMINEIREVYPGATVCVLAPESLTELYENLPAVDETIAIPGEYIHGLRGVLKIQQMVEGGSFDVGYVLPPSFGSAAAFKLAGVGVRIGYISDGRRLLLSKPLPRAESHPSQHRSESYLELLRRGVGKEVPFARPKLFVSDENDLHARELLDQFGLSPERSFIVVAFQAVAESRRWGLDNYASLISRIIDAWQTKVVLIGSVDEREAGEKLRNLVTKPDEVINLAGGTNISELAAVISRARLFVGNDSGSAHMAAAVSTPLVVLSGADNPDETSPVYSEKKLIYRDSLECISCLKNRCPLSGDAHMRCMNDISVDDLFTAATKLRETVPF